MEAQTKQIKQHLLQGRSITPIEALNRFGCFRLSGRIFDLKREGLNISTKMVEKGGKRFAEYKIA